MTFVKREVPLIIATLLALVMIASFFLNIPPLNNLATEAQRGIVPIAAAAGVVGGISLLLHQVQTVQKRRRNWRLSVIFIAVFFFFLATSLTPGIEAIHKTLYTAIVGRTTEAMWGIIALFMVSIAYRAFKIKNLETLLFTLSCVIVLLGNAPIGEILPGSRSATEWLMNVPSMAGMRAIVIGLGLGIIAYGIRVMLGHERSVLGEVLKEEGQ